ncbi:hypothetical protein C4565_09945 [Candidatus Parcubacteria bacterium]|nr:MAG: hypothetical protein C4565_09945 [Candidatus Parcubacteria bacterium]
MTAIGAFVGIISLVLYMCEWLLPIKESNSEKRGNNISVSSSSQKGGITAQTVIVLRPGASDVEKEKADIYSEIQSICEQLNDEYKHLIQAKIDSEFFNVTRLRSLGSGSCIPLDDPPIRIKPIDQCWLSIDDRRKSLVREINKIEHTFNITNDLKNEIKHLKVSKYSDNLAFQRARPSEMRDCNELRAWRTKAQKQGNEYLEKWFKAPYSRLLKELKKQL